MDPPFFGSPPKHIGLRKKSSSSRKSILLWKREQLGQIRLNEMWSKFHSALLYSVSLTDFWQLRPHFRSFKMCGRFEENQTCVIIWSCLRRSQQSSFDWFQRQQFLLRLIAVAEAAGKSLWIKAAAKITLMLKKKKKRKKKKRSRQQPGSGGGDHLSFQLKSDSLLLRVFEVRMKWDWTLFIQHTDTLFPPPLNPHSAPLHLLLLASLPSHKAFSTLCLIKMCCLSPSSNGLLYISSLTLSSLVSSLD